MTPRAALAELTDPAIGPVFDALADSTRRRVLARLAQEPADAGSIAQDLRISRQAVAKHLSRLGAAGLVARRTDGRRVLHHPDPRRLEELAQLLELVARGWDRRLAAIAREAERREADDPLSPDD